MYHVVVDTLQGNLEPIVCAIGSGFLIGFIDLSLSTVLKQL